MYHTLDAPAPVESGFEISARMSDTDREVE